MSDTARADLRNQLGNIDQIRDILFGAYLRDYSTRLDQIEDELSVLQQEVRNRTEEVKQVLSTELQATAENFDKRFKTFALKDEDDKNQLQQQIEALNKRLSSHMAEIKQELSSEVKDAIDALDKKLRAFNSKDQDEKAEISQQISLLSKRVTSSMANLDETVGGQVTSLRNDLLSSREKLQDDILTLRQQVYDALDQRVTTLIGSKVAREDLAELLFELGLRLKGTEFVPQLKEAADSNSGYAQGYIVGESEQS